MRTPAYRLLGALPGRGAAILAAIVALGATCLALAGARTRDTLTLRQLGSEGAVLMSCAEDSGVSTEPLWCADPASPHCIPALPEAPRADAWHGPVAALWSNAAPARPQVAEWIPWPTPHVASLLSRRCSQRLERPPRRA